MRKNEIHSTRRVFWTLSAGSLLAVGALVTGAPAETTPTLSATSAVDSAIALKQQKKQKSRSKITKLKNGMIIEELKKGTGAVAKNGNRVSVHYVGTLTNGTKFDSSRDRGTPFSFTLGAGEVIKGWDIGVAGMKEGGKRKLTIPPALGYGDRGAGTVIPPGATLIFVVELIKA